MAIGEILAARGRAADVLEAASSAFLKNGYAKTSLAEIAKGSGISMAHIYNFYPGKLHLVCAVVDAEIARLVARLETAVDPNASAAARLSMLLLLELEETHRLIDQHKGMRSCLQVIMSKRPRHTEELLRLTRHPIETILRSGVLAEEFDIRNSKKAAITIQSATTKFRFPQLWSDTDYSILREQCVSVIRMLLKGIERR
ncbi:TetR/AcrR family transcriptional regulator [Pseudovibrio exalbescens]|uniref:TetR/AcrR family transcriptional regulator n=1 Tax=Pseudovibrio exalbescens TaxID=197461 RepID=UPI00236516AF|nr:TetR/AcrR family transcriptional regulator [Pseudovibrio exalbescens]MDD7909739.1 TetR/AcrR family transcriptional regulator [Pseudovibrio exalbescens]